MSKFYYVFLEPDKSTNYDELKKSMDKCLDWFKIGTLSWIIYSSSDIESLEIRFDKFAKPEGALFISELNIKNRNGWMTKEFWDWLHRIEDKEK